MATDNNNRSEKKVLIISYLFPPEVGGVGVIRTVKFIKWLKRLGWEPVVLTVKRPDRMTPDPSLLKEIQDVKILRCNDYFRGVVRGLLMKLAKLTGNRFGVSSDTTDVKLIDGRFSVIKRVLFDITCIPDECIGWIIPAILQGIKVIKEERISIILSTSPPFSAHLVGYVLKKACSKPLVLDFRDRWVGHPLYGSYTSWRTRVNRWFEKLVVSDCDSLVTVTEGLAQYFRATYAGSTVRLIFNGYDNEDFAFEKINGENKSKLVISHIGGLAQSRSVQCILSAMGGLNQEILDDIELHLVGAASKENEQYIERSTVRKHIKRVPFCTYKDALNEMVRSDVLVILLALKEDGCFALTGKLFEYLRAGKPVLAICPQNSELWNLVESHNLGISVDIGDIEGIKQSITTLHRLWEDGSLSSSFIAPSWVLEKFDRKEQAGQLIEIFEEISSGG